MVEHWRSLVNDTCAYSKLKLYMGHGDMGKVGRRLIVGKLAEALGYDFRHQRRTWLALWRSRELRKLEGELLTRGVY